MRVLHVMPSYYPATYYGGPIFSTYALCNALARRTGVELRVLASDMAGPKLSQRVPVTAVPMRYEAGYDVYFARRVAGVDIAPGLISRIWRNVGWADVVLLTGTYSFPTIPTLLACRLRGKPVVWSPRGALKATQDWSGASRKSLKQIWEWACRRVAPARCLLHVTTDMEKSASLARMPRFAAAIIPNGVDAPQVLAARSWRPSGALRLMALGRLDPVKAIENLLRAMPLINVQATLDVYGAGDPGYLATLAALTAELGLERRVRFHGHVDGEEKHAAFAAADVFVLPSHTENFSMVVAEALAHGVPVVASRGAPWQDLVTHGCGCWVSNDPAALAAGITALADQDLAAMGRRGRAWMQSEFGWDGRADEMRAAFEQVIAMRRTP